MKRKKMFPFILLFLFLGSISLQGQGFVLQKDIFVAEGEIQDSVLSFGGNILIKGKVRQNVVAFGGQITIEGEVGESILGFGSEVTIKSSAEVNGDVVSIGGTLDKEFGALIKGDTIHFDFAKSGDFQRFLKEGLFGVFGMSLIPLFLIIKLITLFIWFVLGIVLAAIFPHQLCLFTNTKIFLACIRNRPAEHYHFHNTDHFRCSPFLHSRGYTYTGAPYHFRHGY